MCDLFTEGLIYFMVVFTPWAFGTTEEWSIWTMNITAYVLGVLLITKWMVRWRAGYKPARWGEVSAGDEVLLLSSNRSKLTSRLTIALAALSVIMLGYCFVSALNARALYLPGLRRFEYFETIKWLPQSYDAASSWESFWMYLGLALFFWSFRDWLLGKTPHERHRSRLAPGKELEADEASSGWEGPEGISPAVLPRGRSSDAGGSHSKIPARLQRLLWVLCINGGLLALECILQRLSGTHSLLWILEPRLIREAEGQFGPYAYRSNAAQYFNLLWPVCLGFWLLLRQGATRKRRIGARIGESNHVVLLPMAVIMAACPVISTSRGGALVAVMNLIATMAVLFWALRKESVAARATVLALFVAIACLSGYLGWYKLAARMRTIFQDQMSRRPEIYQNAVEMTQDCPAFGTGPGTFGSLYQLYRKNVDQAWAGYAHDDWLETRITFGWIGFIGVVGLLAIVAGRAWGTRGLNLNLEFLAMLVLSLMGCLMHAKFDFPFQIYSVLFLFLLVAGIYFCVSPRKTG